MNHRLLQRALFRMQLDPGFAARLRAGDPAALGSTGLDPAEWKCLATADPAGVSADRDGQRRGQFMRNLSSELPLSTALWPVDGSLDAFPESAEFHTAVCRDESLPLAFAAYATRLAGEARSPVFAALVALESRLARARRSAPARTALAAGEVVLAPWATLLEAREGTLEAATRVRQALDAARPPPRGLSVASSSVELLLVSAPPDPNPFRPPGTHVEKLEPGVATFLATARAPLDLAARRSFALDCDADAADIEALVDGLVTDGVLLRGS